MACQKGFFDKLKSCPQLTSKSEARAMSQNAIELKNISKYFGPVAANHHVSLTVRKGEILSLLGSFSGGFISLLSGPTR